MTLEASQAGRVGCGPAGKGCPAERRERLG